MPTFTTYYNLAKPLVNDPTDEDVWGNELNSNMDIIDSTLHTIATSVVGGTPAGTVVSYAGSTAPSGWLLCFGQAVNRTTFSDLFSVIGTTYGAGDGATTFNVPDCRGRVDAGKDDMGGTPASRLTNSPTGGVVGSGLGNTGGSQGHVLTTAQLATHTHSGSTSTDGAHSHTVEGAKYPTNDSTYADIYTGTNASFGAFSGGGDNYFATIAGGSRLIMRAKASGSDHSHTLTTSGAGSDSSHNNVQPTIIFNKIIKT